MQGLVCLAVCISIIQSHKTNSIILVEITIPSETVYTTRCILIYNRHITGPFPSSPFLVSNVFDLLYTEWFLPSISIKRKEKRTPSCRRRIYYNPFDGPLKLRLTSYLYTCLSNRPIALNQDWFARWFAACRVKKIRIRRVFSNCGSG